MAPPAVPAEVAVSLADFLRAVRMMRSSASPGRVARAHLRPAPNGLRIEFGGASTALAAEGIWRIDATVSRRHLLRLGDDPPGQDPLGLRVSGRRLFIGEAGLPCRWRLAASSLLELPERASIAELAGIAEGLDLDSVADPDLRRSLAEARESVRQAIRTAADALAPFGIGEFDLRMLVRRKLRQNAPRAFHPEQRELFASAEPRSKKGKGGRQV